MPYILCANTQNGTKYFETYRGFISSNEVLVLFAMSSGDGPSHRRSIKLPLKHGVGSDNVGMTGE